MLPDPRLVPFISSNDPFPSSLADHLEAYLGSLDKRIGELEVTLYRLEGEFERLRTQLQTARSERKNLAEKRSQYQRVNTAVRRLPPEVVALILRHALTLCHGLGGGRGRALGKHDREYFAGLRSVSRLWRTTAMTTPDLWRYLEVVLEADTSSSQLASRLKGWFSKGGTNAELMLKLSRFGVLPHGSTDILPCLNQPGLNFATISLGSYDSREDVLRLLRPIDVFQSTRNVSLSWAFGGLSPEKPQWRPLSEVFPRLESLALRAEVPLHTIFPQHHLVSLHLNKNPFNHLNELSDFLPSAGSLQELILRFDGLSKSCERCSYKPIQFEDDSDSSTDEDYSDSSTDEDEFDEDKRCSPPAFTFPSLELFHVVHRMQHIDGMFPHLREFIQRSNGPNLTLDLSSAILRPLDLYYIFKYVPALDTLHLNNPQSLFELQMEQYGVYTAPPTQIEVIVFTSTHFKETPTFETWSQIIGHRFDRTEGRTRVYYAQAAAEAIGEVDVGALTFIGVDEHIIKNLTEERFPLRNHVDCVYYTGKEDTDDDDSEDSDSSSN
ncbi:hypothetical protein BKA70DRAFT_1314230 [Coprinopsis sp. MPI-PUGE-AT-0042]|nr:hypothetical protein BKA70DRAFT_1314230 [Coprinopsis sp. MPI-PUGE-AT-0042]